MNTLFSKQAHRLGFTLLELLVVISIIGILVAMGAAAFTNAQQKSRDARRQSDMKAIQSGMEQFYSQNASSYPGSCAGLAGILDPFPEDPQSSNPDYTCGITGGGTGYCACASLENATGNSTAPGCASFANAGDYFCVQNLQ